MGVAIPQRARPRAMEKSPTAPPYRGAARAPLREARPIITGKQYLDSLHDGRRTYIEGHRIDDLATEPTTRVAVAAVAAGYDHFYREGAEARHPLLTPPRSAEG